MLLPSWSTKKLLRAAAAVLCAGWSSPGGTLAASAYTNRLMGRRLGVPAGGRCSYQAAALVQDADPQADARPGQHRQILRRGYLPGPVHPPRSRPARGGVPPSGEDVTQEGLERLHQGHRPAGPQVPGFAGCGERLGVFLNTVHQNQTESNQKIVFAATVLVYTDDPAAMRDNQKDFLYNSIGAWPVNQTLRQDFIMSLSYRTEFLGGLPAATWWMLPSFGLLAAAILVLLVRRGGCSFSRPGRWPPAFRWSSSPRRTPTSCIICPPTWPVTS